MLENDIEYAKTSIKDYETFRINFETFVGIFIELVFETSKYLGRVKSNFYKNYYINEITYNIDDYKIYIGFNAIEKVYINIKYKRKEFFIAKANYTTIKEYTINSNDKFYSCNFINVDPENLSYMKNLIDLINGKVEAYNEIM